MAYAKSEKQHFPTWWLALKTPIAFIPNIPSHYHKRDDTSGSANSILGGLEALWNKILLEYLSRRYLYP